MKRIANAFGFLLALLLLMSVGYGAQTEPVLEGATAAVLKAFQSHDIIMLGETHGNKQEYDWLRSLVAAPEFANRVDDIVVEVGNSLYQDVVDRYVRGDEIPLEQVQGAWLDTVASVGPPSPVYASLYRAVRETNMTRKDQHQLRILCGDRVSIGRRSEKQRSCCRTCGIASYRTFAWSRTRSSPSIIAHS